MGVSFIQTYVLICSVAAADHHDWAYSLLCFIKWDPGFLLYRHMCWSVLWLLLTTMTGHIPCYVLFNGSLLICSVAAADHHDWAYPLLWFIKWEPFLLYRHMCWSDQWLLLTTMTGHIPFCVLLNGSRPGFFCTDICVDLFCGCCWPPWLGICPSVFYWMGALLYRHMCWSVLWLLLTTMTGHIPFCVLLNGTRFSSIPTYVLICSVTAADHHDWASPLLWFIKWESVDLFCGCCWPPWLGISPSVTY